MEKELEILLNRIAAHYYETGLLLETEEFPALSKMQEPKFRYDYNLNDGYEIEFADISSIKNILYLYYCVNKDFEFDYNFLSILKAAITHYVTALKYTSVNINVDVLTSGTCLIKIDRHEHTLRHYLLTTDHNEFHFESIGGNIIFDVLFDSEGFTVFEPYRFYFKVQDFKVDITRVDSNTIYYYYQDKNYNPFFYLAFKIHDIPVENIFDISKSLMDISKVKYDSLNVLLKLLIEELLKKVTVPTLFKGDSYDGTLFTRDEFYINEKEMNVKLHGYYKKLKHEFYIEYKIDFVSHTNTSKIRWNGVTIKYELGDTSNPKISFVYIKKKKFKAHKMIDKLLKISEDIYSKRWEPIVSLLN